MPLPAIPVLAWCASFLTGYLVRSRIKGKRLEWKLRRFTGSLTLNEKHILEAISAVNANFIEVEMTVEPGSKFWREKMRSHGLLPYSSFWQSHEKQTKPIQFNGPPDEVAAEVCGWFHGIDPFLGNFKYPSPLKVTIKLWAYGKRVNLIPEAKQLETQSELPDDLDERIIAAAEVVLHDEKARKRV